MTASDVIQPTTDFGPAIRDVSDFPLDAERGPDMALASNAAENFFTSKDWSAARFGTELIALPALIDGLLLLKTVALLYSAGGAGKSTFILGLSIRVALGLFHPTKFLGRKVTGGRVVILTAEDPDPVLTNRLIQTIEAIAEEYLLETALVRQHVYKNLIIVSTVGESIRLFSVNERTGTLSATKDFSDFTGFLGGIDDLKLLIVDTKSRFSPGEGLGNVVAGQEISLYEQIAQITGACVMLLHHTNKAARNGTSSGAQAFRDASALFDCARFCWYLRGLTNDELLRQTIPNDESKDYLLLENAKNNYLPIANTVILKRSGYRFDQMELKQNKSRAEKKADKVEADVQKVIGILRSTPIEGLNQARVIAECKKGSLSMQRCRDALKEAVEMGLVDESKEGAQKLIYRLTPEGKLYETVSVL